MKINSHNNRMFLLSVVFFFFASPVFAASFSLVPSTPSVVAGETALVRLTVDAAGEKIVTAKTTLAYSPEILEFVSFAPAAGWVPLSVAGFDSVQNGLIIKTGGFPGGFTGVKEFGTITFRAKQEGLPAGQAGTAALSTTPGSLLLDAQGVNRLNGASVASIEITARTPVATDQPVGTGALIEPFTDLKARGETATTAPRVATSTQGAAIAQSSFFVGWRGWVLAVLILCILIVLGWFAWKGRNTFS